MQSWRPRSEWATINTIDAHTAGEPLRIITSGVPPLPGGTILEKSRYLKTHYDQVRRALMGEPRGHADMYGCIVTEPVTPDGDLGVIFMHNEGYSTMCGHGVIGLAKVVLDTGMLHKDGDNPTIKMDTPAGRVIAVAHRVHDQIAEVSFLNVPSFVYSLNQEIEVPGIGHVRFDLSFGGAFYAFCNAAELGVELTPEDSHRLIDIGMRIKHEVMKRFPIQHPFEKDLGFLYGTIIVGPAHDSTHHSRNVCIFADGQIDRSPTGTGVSARAALHYAKGEIRLNQSLTIESIIGTCFQVRAVEPKPFGSYDAIIPEVTGSSHIVGRNEWVIDPSDPLKNGFVIR